MVVKLQGNDSKEFLELSSETVTQLRSREGRMLVIVMLISFDIKADRSVRNCANTLTNVVACYLEACSGSLAVWHPRTCRTAPQPFTFFCFKTFCFPVLGHHRPSLDNRDRVSVVCGYVG